jgi:formylglycine-generating enzyme required for sulfatase activity
MLATDRASYQPGQLVVVTGSGLPPQLTAATTWSPPGGLSQTLRSVRIDSAGAFSFSFPLPASTATGTHNILATVAGTAISLSAQFNVLGQPGLSLLVLSAASVNGGASVTGTVTLSAAAPGGGVTVGLQSSSAAAQLPAGGSVTVPAGQSSVTFTITTQAVSGAQSVTITASYAGVSKTATLTVNPAPVSLQGLTLSQSSVTGGATVTGTVTLGAAAPAGGASVTVQSSSTAAQVPASVTVAAGQTSATFTVTTQAVSGAQNVTITASYAGVSKTATLTVNPAQGGSQPGTLRVNPQDGLNHVWIPPGTYTMGCSPGDSECYSDESPSHSVTISKGFWMGQTEVTAGAYKRFAQAAGRTMPSGPSWDRTWTQDNLPMVYVTWDDARSYCAWAGGRLPTEAEWEYAARAGTQTKYYFGSDAALLGDYAWYYNNSAGMAHPVGQKKPNAWGLYDMLGNVRESCQDRYGSYPSQAVTDPQGPSSGTNQILRRGSWLYDSSSTRVSYRGNFDPAGWDDNGGFRCVREVIPESAASVSLQALTLSQTSVTAGASVTGTVTLSAAAPAGGASDTLQSGSTAAQVPASVTVAAGQTSAPFTITTQAVSAAQNVTVTASYAGVSKTATLTVNPVQGVSQPGTVRVNPQDGLNYVWIPAGMYTMGCSPGDFACYGNESPSHSVTISKGFWMGQTEVTVGAYKRFAQATGRTMPSGPSWDSTWKQDNLPMVNVTWDDARSYCTWAGGRLPSEAEWEYAARAGSQTKYYFGNDAALLGEYAWYESNSGGMAHPVGQKKPNAWGLYDMLGDAWEWCQDWYGMYSSQAVTDPQGPSSGVWRTLRGGSWHIHSGYIRVSSRNYLVPLYGYHDAGLRCVREVIP